MSIYTDPPEWEDAGKKPPSSKRGEGWKPGDRVPASWLNWFWFSTVNSLREIAGAFVSHRDATSGVHGVPEGETIATARYVDGKLDAHIADKNNPHSVTKSQVGLGNVENYGVAAQADAEAGSANNKYMTPLRVAQAIAALGASRSWVETTFYPRSFWASSASASGYVKFPNGIIIQWGLSPSVGHDGNTSAAFPIAFPTDCLRVIAVKQNSTTSHDDNFAVVRGFSKTRADFRMEGVPGSQSGTRYVAYLAIGY